MTSPISNSWEVRAHKHWNSRHSVHMGALGPREMVDVTKKPLGEVGCWARLQRLAKPSVMRLLVWGLKAKETSTQREKTARMPKDSWWPVPLSANLPGGVEGLSAQPCNPALAMETLLEGEADFSQLRAGTHEVFDSTLDSRMCAPGVERERL